MTSGYSGTPLAKKLSLKDGMRVWWDGVPDSVRGRLRRGPAASDSRTAEAPIDAAQFS